MFVFRGDLDLDFPKWKTSSSNKYSITKYTTDTLERESRYCRKEGFPPKFLIFILFFISPKRSRAIRLFKREEDGGRRRRKEEDEEEGMRKEKSQLYRINAKKYQQIGFQIRVKDIKRGVCRNGGKNFYAPSERENGEAGKKRIYRKKC